MMGCLREKGRGCYEKPASVDSKLPSREPENTAEEWRHALGVIAYGAGPHVRHRGRRGRNPEWPLRDGDGKYGCKCHAELLSRSLRAPLQSEETTSHHYLSTGG